jgi:hypothetical protein
MMGRIMNSAAGQNLINQLIGGPTRLSGTLVGQALNYNSGAGLIGLLPTLVNGLNGKTIAASVNANGYAMTVELLNNLSAARVATAVNAAIANYPNGLLHHFGIGIYLKARFIFEIVLQGEGYVTELGSGALP